jgi:hypothetical protein
MFRNKLAPPPALETTLPANVTVLHPRISARQSALLARWVAAGQRMGLCDAHAYSPKRDERGLDYVLVWVRENADPAYMVQSQGTVWVITDLVRQQVLASKPSFGAALHFIRPVLPLEAAA